MTESGPVDVLLVEDEPAHAELIQRAFEDHPGAWRVAHADTLQRARALLRDAPPRLIIADWLLTDGEGIDLLREIPAEGRVPVIIMTSHGNERVAVDAMKAGAVDYVVKSEATLEDMAHIADRALGHRRVEETLREIVEGTSQVGQAYFDSLALRLASALGARFALVNELIDGEAERIRSLAFVADGALRDNVEYAIAGTPDEVTLGQEETLQSSAVAEQFPASELVRDLGASRYLGIRLVSSTGHNLGTLSVLSDGAINRVLDPESILRVFGARAAAEMERLRTDRTLKSLQRRLQHEATHDLLTGLSNRRLFSDRCVTALDRFHAHGSLCAVLFCDLDDFKLVNETLGYAAGDALLSLAAARIANALRAGDLAARFGGDEFALLLEDLESADEAYAAGSRIVETLREPFLVEGQLVRLRASIGVTVASAKHNGADRVLRDASTALVLAKEGGGDRVEMFDESMGARVSRRRLIEQALHQAISDGKLTVHFQPQMDVRSRAIRGFEALARWEDPILGTIGPGEFVPIAESSGLIVPLGHHILDKACGWLAAQHRAGASDVSVAVNLSGRQLQRPELVEEVAALLKVHRIPASKLHLEITESIAMSHASVNIERLQALKQIGVRIVVDDFGTGYSSLAYLRRFPIDVLKIDRSFVNNLGRDAEDADIVRFLIALAGSLGMGTIAEGVESPNQLELLRELGCGEAQGFLVGRPMAGPYAAEWLVNHPALNRNSTASIKRPRW